jgi:hypothetical protein
MRLFGGSVVDIVQNPEDIAISTLQRVHMPTCLNAYRPNIIDAGAFDELKFSSDSEVPTALPEIL